MALGKRKSTRKEYHIPDDIKAHITKEFGREFLNQLECVYIQRMKKPLNSGRLLCCSIA